MRITEYHPEMSNDEVMGWAVTTWDDEVEEVTNFNLIWKVPCSACGKTTGTAQEEGECMYWLMKDDVVLCERCIEDTDLFAAAAVELDQERRRSEL